MSVNSQQPYSQTHNLGQTNILIGKNKNLAYTLFESIFSGLGKTTVIIPTLTDLYRFHHHLMNLCLSHKSQWFNWLAL